jgi:YXWGXW repeat-containing protein
MRILRSSILILMLSAATAASFAGTAEAQVAIDVRVNIPPPPLPYYEQPVIPAEGYLWVPGFWAWDEAEADYYWVPGTWVEPPQPELLWTPAYWGWVEGRYLFHPGYWAREIGFYGGIDYGYGYTGEGYFGGRWDHGVFFYNRTFNNVESVRITNVYNQTVVVNNRTTNVSFNGGNGGTTVRPTPQQETIARERHVDATPVQRQQVQTASKDRALFSKQNHGEPAVAATPRAGVFQGAGVSRGSRTPVAAKSNNEPASNGAERPAAGANKEMPRAGEQPNSARRPGQAEPRANETQTPKAEEKRAPAREPSRTEEQRRPTEERPKVEEERRPAQGPRPEERRPPEQPRTEEQRRAPQAPPRAEQPRGAPQAPPRVEAPRAPAAQPREMAPTAARPAPGGRPPAEEKKRE